MQLRDYQTAAVDAVWADLFQQAGNPLLVMPTGSGKSPVIGSLCQTAVEKYRGRVIVLAHRKELLEQNAEKIRAFLPPSIPVGLHSAGLRRHATDEPIICAGIQSVYSKAALFGSRQLVLIDEAHLVPDDGEGMYRKFINDLREINPKLRIVGLTATPFRTGTGSMCRADTIFQRVCHEVPVKQLIDDGWLSKIISESGAASIDTEQLHIRGGEFRQDEAERAFDSKVVDACREIVEKTADRKSILVFCQGVDHAEHVRECLDLLTKTGVGLVTGETSPIERSGTLAAFREQSLRIVVNVDVLTTGFDAPSIDAIAVLRATMSPGLFAQIVGRGLRLSPGKSTCLVLDFGENVQRHGKLDDPLYGRRPKEKRGNGEAVEKQCPNCNELVAGGARECPACGFAFPDNPRQLKHNGNAGNEELLGYKSEPEWFTVEAVSYSKHQPRNADKLPTLRVNYECKREDGSNLPEVISEWVCVEHDGYARKKACLWWLARTNEHCPQDAEQAAELAKTLDNWKEPKRIKAQKEGVFWRILEAELELREPSFDFGGQVDDDITF